MFGSGKDLGFRAALQVKLCDDRQDLIILTLYESSFTDSCITEGWPLTLPDFRLGNQSELSEDMKD